MSKPFFVTLPHRGLIHIEGKDRLDFLQGLVSNDVHKLEEEKILYSCLLTPQGKFLHDFFMHWGTDFILLDCEGGDRAKDLYNRLNKYKLRSDVQISVEENHPVYVAFDNEEDGLPDPRHYRMGRRSFEKPTKGLEEGFVEWDKERILLGIADGSRDMIVEKSTLLEYHLDKFNAINWDKGCYMGQELTARMHYRGLAKKHLQTIRFKTAPPPPFSDIEINGKVIGNMRSACGDIGLALIKDDALGDLKNGNEDTLRLLG